jgi:hypothetical protein
MFTCCTSTIRPNRPNQMTDQLINLMQISQRRIPFVAIFVQLLTTDIFFRDCSDDPANQRGLIYYPFLLAICMVCWLRYESKYYETIWVNAIHHERIVVLLCIIKLLTFMVISFYIRDGRPFCNYFNYNREQTEIIFYVVMLVNLLISVVELIERQNVQPNQIV